jgi:microcin C transport system permease protein
LGDLLHQAKNNLYAPWLGFVAFGGISTVLVLIAFVGEALRDAMATHQLDANRLAVAGA